MTEYKEYYDEDEYLEDIYGDEIKVGDVFYKVKLNFGRYVVLVHEKNIVEFALEELNMTKEER